MSLELFSQEGEDLFSVPSTERNTVWASKLNNLRSKMLFRVIEVFPSAKEVKKTAPPLFYKAIKSLKELKPSSQDLLAYHLPGLLKNFQTDVKELKKYVNNFQEYDS